MALFTTLASLSQTASSNAPDGSTDAPSTIDDNLRLLGSFDALLRDGAHVYVASVAGTNTITGNIATNPTSYTVGQAYRFVAAGANTGAVTLNFNSIGSKPLLKVGNAALTGGELQGTSVYEVVYDGVNFQLVGMYGFKNNKVVNGYQYLPSGVILQWGDGTGATGGATTKTLPIAFPNFVTSVILTPIGGVAAMATLESASASNFAFSVWNVTGARLAVGVNWQAIGY